MFGKEKRTLKDYIVQDSAEVKKQKALEAMGKTMNAINGINQKLIKFLIKGDKNVTFPN